MISFFNASEIISMIEIIINILIIFFVANYFQNKENASRTLKDFFIKELEISKEKYDSLFDKLEDKFEPKLVANLFLNHISKFSNLTELIEKQYDISTNDIINKILSLQMLVENDINYSRNYDSNSEAKLGQSTISDIQNFRYEYLDLEFYNIIININNSKISFLPNINLNNNTFKKIIKKIKNMLSKKAAPLIVFSFLFTSCIEHQSIDSLKEKHDIVIEKYELLEKRIEKLENENIIIRDSLKSLSKNKSSKI